MRRRVLILQDIAEPGKRYLRERGYEVCMGSGADEDSIIRDAANCSAILARNERITRRVIEHIPQVRVISKHGVNTEHIDLSAAREQGIWVTNCPAFHAVAAAEHVVMLLLACAKRLVSTDLATRSGDFFVRDTARGTDVDGKTLGLVGVDQTAVLTAYKCRRAFNMRVIGCGPYAGVCMPTDGIERAETMQEVFEQADFVSLHFPADTAYQNAVGAPLLRRMKPTAYLLNTSWGGAVNERELYLLLQSGAFAGAGLDVYAQEPPDMQNPLFTLPNVTLTPHNASLTYESADRMSLYAAQGIDEVLSGRMPTWPLVIPAQLRAVT